MGRENEMRPVKGAVLSEVQRKRRRQYCSHSDAPIGCAKKIINAHTIQKNGGLSALKESDHVGHLADKDGEILFEKIGVNSASTFPGFCSSHDNAMFASIETGSPTLQNQDLFLFAFRAVSYSLYAKNMAGLNLEVLRRLDSGLPLFEQAVFQQKCILPRHIGIQRSINELQAAKQLYDRAYRANDFSHHKAVGWLFDGVLPVAYCGVFHPEYDMAGINLQQLGCGTHDFELLSACLTPRGATTLLTLGWFGDANGPSAQFAQSICDLPSDQVAEVAILLGFEEMANLFFRQSWWEGLSTQAQSSLLNKRRAGSDFGPEKLPPSQEDRTGALAKNRILSRMCTY